MDPDFKKKPRSVRLSSLKNNGCTEVLDNRMVCVCVCVLRVCTCACACMVYDEAAVAANSKSIL